MRGIEAFAENGPRVDAAIVGEPTELRVVSAHKGMTRWRLYTIGKTAHSSRPDLGDNAIYQMICLRPTDCRGIRTHLEQPISSAARQTNSDRQHHPRRYRGQHSPWELRHRDRPASLAE